jgi:pimeloyl-ACP methyl ester carboxylesterase
VNRAVLLAAFLAAYVALSMLMALQGSGVEVSEGYFESGGARLRYLAWRPRGRVVGTALLYHGFGGSSEMMGWIGVELARAGYLAVAYDARGHGKSSSTLSYDPSLLVEDFRALARLFNFVGELVLVGHSMGGRAVQDLASRLNASRVVVVAAPPAGSPSAPSLLVLAGFDRSSSWGTSRRPT